MKVKEKRMEVMSQRWVSQEISLALSPVAEGLAETELRSSVPMMGVTRILFCFQPNCWGSCRDAELKGIKLSSPYSLPDVEMVGVGMLREPMRNGKW